MAYLYISRFVHLIGVIGMEDTLNAYTEESLNEWEENDEMDSWEAAFIRGTEMEYDESEEA